MTPTILSHSEGRWPSSRTLGQGCGGRGSVGARGVFAGRSDREWTTRARRTMLMRTAKPCGPGARCWCQAAGGDIDPTGSDQPSSRQRRWQDEFVAGESTA